jgi:hypothetical protein
MRADYEACNLPSVADWNEREECIPPTVGMPKDKNPREKTRVINSYGKGPHREALRIVSKALTWIFRQAPREFTAFTLHSVTDAKEELERGNRKLLKSAREGWGDDD